MNLPIIPVVLCGGSGTRLWPLSREQYPKQLLSLLGEHTLLQQTLLRSRELTVSSEPMLICNEDHRFLVAEQARAIGLDALDIVLEPVGRNTAPAVAISALLACEKHKDAYLVVLPSDHVIGDEVALQAALANAVALAQQDRLVTFGITPTGPETGYGYIKAGSALEFGLQVEAFVEKPDADTAQAYVNSGDYFWNSGMFVFKASVYLRALKHHRPDIYASVAAAAEGFEQDQDFLRIDKECFTQCPAESLDYAVMEKTDRAAVVNLNAGWSDIGSWDALWEVSDKDTDGNAVRGDVVLHDANNNLVFAEHRLVTAVGIEDVVIVETADAVVVASKDKSQHIKYLVESLKRDDREEPMTHRKVYRPWGYFESLDHGSRFQVKRICVNPGASLSLQKHFHRAEHWVVVSGTAEVTRGDSTFQLTENESTYIAVGEVHRLANPGVVPLEIIEVQSGHYLGEDDIVRFNDSYGRNIAQTKDRPGLVM